MAESRALFFGMSTGTQELLTKVEAVSNKASANEANISAARAKADKNEGDIAALKSQIAALTGSLSAYDYVVEYKTNEDGSWYRKYKSGWIEQSGIQTYTNNSANTDVNFLVSFKNTNYFLSLQHFTVPDHAYEYSKEEGKSAASISFAEDLAGITSMRTTSGFKVNYTTNPQICHRWYACGEAAS